MGCVLETDGKMQKNVQKNGQKNVKIAPLKWKKLLQFLYVEVMSNQNTLLSKGEGAVRREAGIPLAPPAPRGYVRWAKLAHLQTQPFFTPSKIKKKKIDAR